MVLTDSDDMQDFVDDGLGDIVGVDVVHATKADAAIFEPSEAAGNRWPVALLLQEFAMKPVFSADYRQVPGASRYVLAAC